MSIINGKIKVNENKAIRGMETLKFNISYNINSSEEEQRKNSHKIVSALKGSNNLLIDVDTSLLNLPDKERETCVIDFVKYIRNIGLEYKYRKYSHSGGQSLFGKLFSFGNKSNDAHKVFALVSEEAWNNQDFISSLPFYGVKYYIFNEGVDINKTLDDLYNGQLLDFELYERFSAIVFDSCSFGQMGVFTESLTLQDIKSSLKL